MDAITRPVRRKPCRSGELPNYVRHRSFGRKTAADTFNPKPLLAEQVNYDSSYMPDDITKQHAMVMHYAAHRMHSARTTAELNQWRGRYLALRDRIVLGNRKLVYRAVKRRMAASHSTDDLIGDCHIVLIHAVAAFNPWIGIRFSTYAYTCLVRALSRSSQKSMKDLLSNSLSLSSPQASEPSRFVAEPSSHTQHRLENYLRADHPLLTAREKRILSRRFRFEEISGLPTLENVGRTMGLSKERVRQMQISALDKLRQTLLTTGET